MPKCQRRQAARACLAIVAACVGLCGSQDDVQESVKRWWKLVHPADRPIARKYLLTVLTKSNATLEAICEGLTDIKDFETHRETLPRIQTFPTEAPSQRLKAM